MALSEMNCYVNSMDFQYAFRIWISTFTMIIIQDLFGKFFETDNCQFQILILLFIVYFQK